VPTPNIQHLADQGVLFRGAFCATPTCSTSRACLLTGQYGHNNGMLGLAHRGWGLRSPEVIRLLPHDVNIDHTAERDETWEREDYRRRLDWALREGTTPNGVFGAKMMWGYFPDFLELARGIPRLGGMGDGSLLNAAFPGLHYVFNDKVRQAVSLWRALQTWVWRQEAGAPEGEPAPVQRPVYSLDAIDHLLDQLRRLARLLLSHRATALSIFYEDVVGDLRGSVERVLTPIGVEPYLDWTLPVSSPRGQSDELSESWVQNYLEDVSRR
jgi:trehalose 2-sulfotransferase